MATYRVFINSKAAFVSADKRKAKKAFRKTPTAVEVTQSTQPLWGEKIVHQTVTLWRGSITIGAK